MVEMEMNINKHSWDGRGGPRGLVTHVWDRNFVEVMREIETGGLGRYRFTFERIGDVKGKTSAVEGF